MHAPKAGNKERPKSQEIFRRATDVLVGGVNSPVRAFRAVGGEPIVVERAAGARLWDADENEYLDYVCSWGALILGHAHPKVVEAIADQARRGTSYGMPTELEVDLATRITLLAATGQQWKLEGPVRSLDDPGRDIDCSIRQLRDVVEEASLDAPAQYCS